MAFFRVLQKENITMVICKTTPLDKIDGMRIGILERNGVKGLFRIKKDGNNRFTYTAPHCFPIKDYLLINLSELNFFKIALQILEIVRNAEEKGLIANNLIMDLNHVFVEPKNCDVFFLYRPTVSSGKEKKALDLVADILHYYNKKHSKESPLCSEVVELMKGGNFTEIMLENHIRIKYPQLFVNTRNSQSRPNGFTTVENNAPSVSFNRVQPMLQNVEYQLMNEGTTLLKNEDDGIEATTLLCEPQVQPIKTIRLRRIKNGDVFIVSQQEFSIGKEEGNDLVIRDNKTISRRHAVMKGTPEGYTLIDLNSLNHSYLNGKILVAGQEERISDGDVVRLSDEEFKVEE